MSGDALPGDDGPPPPPDGDGSAGSTPAAGGNGRVAPHSLEAEVSVLGAAMLSRNAASDVLELLRPEDFYRTAHRVVFEAIGDLMHRGEVVDAVTLLDHLASREQLDEVGGSGAVHDLVEAVPTAANAVHYARIVREKSLLRRLIDTGTRIAQLGYDESTEARAALDRAESMMYEVSQTGISSEYSRLRDLLNESFEHIEQLAENRSEVTGLATGFNDLDRITSGLQDQNLIIVAARPSMGKSSLALNVSEYVTAELGQPAAIFSLEMSKIEIVNRLLASQARIDTKKLQTGRLADGDWRKLGDALGKLSEAPLFIDDTPSITMMEIASKCRRLKQKHGLSLVVVDYLQLMQTHSRFDNRVQEVAELSRGLKMLAKELDIPVMALSQLSRNPESRTDKRPILADLRESGSIEQDADLVGFIYRDEVYNEDTQDKGLAELILAKHRNGPTGTIKLAFLGHLTKFANLARSGTGPDREPQPQQPPPKAGF